MKDYSPIELAISIEKIIIRNKTERKYYRIGRPGLWYGGIATCDCCGCNLKCYFCWSNKPRDFPESTGAFYTPEMIAESLIRTARINHYKKIRISGNEPTLARSHLIRLLEETSESGLEFILETNGIMIDEEFANALSTFSHLHVRVSLKGTNEEEFHKLTGAQPEFFQHQLNGLKNLKNENIRCHPAVMLSFATIENILNMARRLSAISPDLVSKLEEEYIFLYPHVKKRLRSANLEPLVAFEPDNIPKRLV